MLSLRSLIYLWYTLVLTTLPFTKTLIFLLLNPDLCRQLPKDLLCACETMHVQYHYTLANVEMNPPLYVVAMLK